jgi:hypothetical protein
VWAFGSGNCSAAEMNDQQKYLLYGLEKQSSAAFKVEMEGWLERRSVWSFAWTKRPGVLLKLFGVSAGELRVSVKGRDAPRVEPYRLASWRSCSPAPTFYEG